MMKDIGVCNPVTRRVLVATCILLAVTLANGRASNVSAQGSGNWVVAQAQQAVRQQINIQERSQNRGQYNNRTAAIRFNNDVQTEARSNYGILVRGTGTSSTNNSSYNRNNDRRREFVYEALVSSRGRNRNGDSNVSGVRYNWRDGVGDNRGRDNDNPRDGYRGGYRGGNRPDGRVSYSGPIMNRHSEKGLDVTGGSAQDGANIQQWGYSDQPNQNWDVIDLGNGEVAIFSRNSGMALTVQGGRDANGSNIIQRTWNDTRQQRWRMEDVNNGYFRIISVDNGKCLDVAAQGRQDGANIQLWDYASQANQQWRLRR